MDPFIEDLYKFFLSRKVHALKKLQLYFHIRESDTEICKYLKDSALQSRLAINTSNDLDYVRRVMP